MLLVLDYPYLQGPSYGVTTVTEQLQYPSPLLVYELQSLSCKSLLLHVHTAMEYMKFCRGLYQPCLDVFADEGCCFSGPAPILVEKIGRLPCDYLYLCHCCSFIMARFRRSPSLSEKERVRTRETSTHCHVNQTEQTSPSGYRS